MHLQDNQGQQSYSQTILPTLSLVIFAVITYVAATTSIFVVPREIPFGIMKVLPFGYWLALVLSAALLLFSLSASSPTYLWISVQLIVVLVPGLDSLFFRVPPDLFSTSSAAHISKTGFFNTNQSPFLNFPGAALLFSALAIVTGVNANDAVRIFGLLYNPIVVFISAAVLRKLGLKGVSPIFGAAILDFGFYLQGVLLYTSMLGFVFYILVIGVILAPYRRSSLNILLIGFFFVAMMIYHAFSPFLTFAALTILLIGWELPNRILRKLRLPLFEERPPLFRRSILLTLLTMLLLYWAYFASLPFSWALIAVASTDYTSLLRLAATPLITPTTIYARDYALVTEPYALIALFAFLVYLIKPHDERKLQLLLLIFGLIASIGFALSGYVLEFFARIFAFALVPLSYGIARLFADSRMHLRTLAIVVLLIFLSLHIPAHFGQETFSTVPQDTISGMQFLATHSPFDYDVASPIRQLEDRYYIDVYRIDSARQSGLGTSSVSYFVMSYQAEGWAIYVNGTAYLEGLNRTLVSSRYNRAYSNGWYLIFLNT